VADVFFVDHRHSRRHAMIRLLHLVCAHHLFVALLLGQGLELQFTITKLLCLVSHYSYYIGEDGQIKEMPWMHQHHYITLL
jgi:hypothetical protein